MDSMLKPTGGPSAGRREVHPERAARGAASGAAGQLGPEQLVASDRCRLVSPSTPRQCARTHRMKQWWSSFRRLDALLLGQALGQLLLAASRLVGLGEAGALERDLELRLDGRHHGSGVGRQARGPYDPRRQLEEVVLTPSSSLVGRDSRSLGKEGQPNCQHVLELVHQHSSRVQATLLGHSRSSKATARRALSHRRPKMRSESSEVMVRIDLEPNILLSIYIKHNQSGERGLFFSVCPGFCACPSTASASRRCRPACAARQGALWRPPPAPCAPCRPSPERRGWRSWLPP